MCLRRCSRFIFCCSARQIFRFRLRLLMDVRDDAVGALRVKGVPWRMILVSVLWQGEGRRVRAAGGGRARSCSKTAKAERSSLEVPGELTGAAAPSSARFVVLEEQ